eukprot:TRINITY_DN2015_c0_g1_i1.p1 TRINITY_DN2015_c0_g1~~TRINITY_DN2015_c0_g1_i1.p1  ORF type:complete len:414 (-),score=124.09 TRINITY_DN2015_c0_g1_i1:108-1349(-)
MMEEEIKLEDSHSYDRKSHGKHSARKHKKSVNDSHSSERRKKSQESGRKKRYDAPPSSRENAPEYHRIPPKYTTNNKEEEEIVYDNDESEKDEEFVDQRLEYYTQKLKQISNDSKYLDDSSLPDTRMITRYRMKNTNQKIKFYKELLLKFKSNKKPYKASVNRHLRFLLRKYDLLNSLSNNLRDPIEIKKIQKKINDTKKWISHYNYLKQRGNVEDTTEEQPQRRQNRGKSNREDESSYSFSSDLEAVKRKSKGGRYPLSSHHRTEHRHHYSSHYEDSVDHRKVRPSEESVIELNNAENVPDEVVYHYYKPGKSGGWEHKVVSNVKPYEKQGKVFVKKHHEFKNHHHYLDDENTHTRFSRRDQTVYDGPSSRYRSGYIDDEYVYYDGMKTVYNPHYYKYNHRKPYNIYIKNYY